MSSEALQQVKMDVDDFIDYLKERFSRGGGEVTVFVRNKNMPGQHLLMTSDEYEEIIPAMTAFMAERGVVFPD